jgi:hypothetical protein
METVRKPIDWNFKIARRIDLNKRDWCPDDNLAMHAKDGRPIRRSGRTKYAFLEDDRAGRRIDNGISAAPLHVTPLN